MPRSSHSSQRDLLTFANSLSSAVVALWFAGSLHERAPWKLCFIALSVTMLSGCPKPTETAIPSDALPFEGQSLTLLVVDDPELAAAIGRLTGEWQARTGARLDVREATSAELLSDSPPAADAAIYPAGDLPALAEQDRLLPVPAEMLDDPQWRWDDIFPTLRHQEASWNERLLAVPLGSPVLVCYCRADLLAKHGRQPPRTWQEYGAEFFHDLNNVGEGEPPDGVPWYGATEPLAPGWAGLTLLARAAPYARHPYFHSTLFQIDTMQPLIDGPPFVRALEELVAARAFGPAAPGKVDPAAARDAFWRGECALAVTWARGTRQKSDGPGGREKIEVRFADLPGSVETFHPGDQRWESLPEGDIRRVTLTTISGRLGSVLSGTKHETAAFQLLLSLAAPEWTGRLAGASPATTLFAADQVRAPRGWVEREADIQAAAEYADTVDRSLANEEAIAALRMPGRERYLAALDGAVEQALAGTATPADALKQAAADWQSITDELGKDKQRRAYRISLGQSP
jgi:multiple sugar transport system substrate-binding protein